MLLEDLDGVSNEYFIFLDSSRPLSLINFSILSTLKSSLSEILTLTAVPSNCALPNVRYPSVPSFKNASPETKQNDPFKSLQISVIKY